MFKQRILSGLRNRKEKFMYLNKYFSDSYLKSFLVYFYNKKFLKVLKDEFFTIVTLTNYQLNF